ncbi:unnamed protein product [Cladocopium goreaui]|nr:unnamed protein product [Cladocopium goreaui]
MAFLRHCQAESLQQDIVVLNSHLSELSWPHAFHLFASNRGLRPTRLTWNALAASRWQRALVAGEDGLGPDTVTWTVVLSRGAWQVSLKELRMQGLKVASLTCSALITSCDQRWAEALEWQRLHETLGLQGDLLVHNGVLVACEKTQRWERAVQILLAGIGEADAIGCTTCLTACGRASAWQAALRLLAEMRCILVRAHLISHNACLSACEETGQWRQGLQLLDEMCCTSLGPDSLSCNTAISACEKAKRWHHALGLFHRSRQPNTLTFNTTSSACSKGRQWRWSACLISKLPQESLQPSQISFNVLASGLSHWQRIVQLLESGNPEITLCEEAAIRCAAAWEALPLLRILATLQAPRDGLKRGDRCGAPWGLGKKCKKS